MCTFLVNTLQWQMGGGGGLSSIVDTIASVYIYIYIYIVCSTTFVSLSSCSLASTSMISKYIKLLVPKTINYAIHLESTSLKVHVYHIIELFIYAFKFQFIVKIEYMYVVQKIKSFIYS